MSLSALDTFAALTLLVLGLLIGSFLNVVVARVPLGLSVVRPRSRCPSCGHQLSWFENIPILAWLALGRRCRSCRAPISWRYPAIELLTGLLFVAAFRRFGWTLETPIALALIGLLLPLTFIDLEHWILPFALTIPGIVAGLALSLLLGTERFVASLIGAAAGFLLFWGLEWLGERIFKKEALGGGDKYLLALIGAFLTWEALLGVVFLASFQGAVVGSLLLLTRGRAGPAPTPEPSTGETGAPLDELTGEPSQDSADAPAPSATVATGASTEEGTGEDEEDDWVPGPTNIPFGPWLSIAALEILLVGPFLAEHLPAGLAPLLGGRIW